MFVCQASMAAEKKITIESNDAMQYDVKEFTVTEGDSVTLVLKHTGKLPAAAMGHNLVILKAGSKVPDFAMKAAAASATQYIPQDAALKSLVVANTKILGGGESDTIKFIAPAAGEYPYLCSFPGHFAIMKGKMIVKAK